METLALEKKLQPVEVKQKNAFSPTKVAFTMISMFSLAGPFIYKNNEVDFWTYLQKGPRQCIIRPVPWSRFRYRTQQDNSALRFLVCKILGYVDLVKIHKCRNSSGNEKVIFLRPYIFAASNLFLRTKILVNYEEFEDC